MKTLFFLAVLANLVFFLWEYNAGAFHRPLDNTKQPLIEKQIWLVSELEKKSTVKIAVKTVKTAILKDGKPLSMQTATVNSKIIATELAGVMAKIDHEMLAITKFTPTLLLLQNQIAKENLAVAIASAKEVATNKKTFFCYRISAPTNKAINLWLKRQANEISLLKPIKEVEPLISDYLVYYPAAESMERSKENMEMLKDQGVEDSFVINNGEFKGAISLGVFKDQARAIKHHQSLISQGIPAQLDKRHKTSAIIYLQVKTEKTSLQLLQGLRKQGIPATVQLLSNCD